VRVEVPFETALTPSTVKRAVTTIITTMTGTR